MSKEEQNKKKPVSPSKKLSDFDIRISEFGEITSNYDVERLNSFLDDNVDDKKLQTNQILSEEE